MKQKKQRDGFSNMLLGTSGATLLANMLSGPAGKGVSRAGEEQN